MKFFKYLLAGSLLTSSISAYCLGDVQVGAGYSNYSNDKDLPTQNGLNVTSSFLIPVAELGAGAKFVVGPRLKYENVSGDKGPATYKFSTLQLGAETGLKYALTPDFNLYGTLFGSYGVYNKAEIEFTFLGVSESIEPDVKTSWQAGADLKALYNVTPVVGVGAGVGYAYGKYDTSVKDATATTSYNSFNVSLVASVAL